MRRLFSDGVGRKACQVRDTLMLRTQDWGEQAGETSGKRWGLGTTYA